MPGDDEPNALKEVLEGLALSQQRGNRSESEVDAAHAFWDTQPVPRLAEDTSGIHLEGIGPIDAANVDSVRKDPYGLPNSFEWSDIDLSDAGQAHELYTLLHENYVEDGGQLVLLQMPHNLTLACLWVTCTIPVMPAMQISRFARRLIARQVITCSGSITQCHFCAGHCSHLVHAMNG